LRFAKGLCGILFDSISAGDLPVTVVLILEIVADKPINEISGSHICACEG
jgi:hypothetical protein